MSERMNPSISTNRLLYIWLIVLTISLATAAMADGGKVEEMQYSNMAIKYDGTLLRKKAVIPVLEDQASDAKLFVAVTNKKTSSVEAQASEMVDDFSNSSVLKALGANLKRGAPVKLKLPGFDDGVSLPCFLAADGSSKEKMEVRVFRRGDRYYIMQASYAEGMRPEVGKAIKSAMDSITVQAGSAAPVKKKQGIFSGWWDGVTVPFTFVINLFSPGKYQVIAPVDERSGFGYWLGFVFGIMMMLGGGSSARRR